MEMPERPLEHYDAPHRHGRQKSGFLLLPYWVPQALHSSSRSTTKGKSMSTEELLEKILEKLTAPAPVQQQPISIALWDTNDIAAYLKRHRDRVYTDIVCLPSFPKPIRIPVPGRVRAQALYKAREVIAWAEKQTS
jgi:hypothetical protein